MKPIIKYQGGKTRELPTIRGLLPDKYDTVLEPFAGGAAVSKAGRRTPAMSALVPP